jgi:predicted GTPase
MPTSITLSLISHTNIGKTTLARTLLRKDVGQVLDQAHVTLQNEQFLLLETSDGLQLTLWDTPGFGNSHKLLKRLQGLSNPIGWLVSQVWDRMADKPFWCSQQAIRNVHDEADIVLYLVNATEDPAMAGYLQPELDLLTWLNKPVIMLLNQTGLTDPDQQHRLKARWKQQWSSQAVIYDVMSLDAFTRCWVQEGLLWDRITQALPEDRQPIMAQLSNAWRDQQLDILHKSMKSIAQMLIETANDTETLPQNVSGHAAKTLVKRTVQAMDQRLAHRIAAMSTQLIELHGLSGDTAHTIRSRLEDVTVPGERKPWEEESFWSGLVSGAAAGFASDVATGGLSHGFFTIGGAILGALGGTAYAKSQDEGDASTVSWVPDFLDRQTRDALLRYLAVTHCGRGRGDYSDPREFPLFWQQETERVLEQKKETLKHLWEQCQTPAEQKSVRDSTTHLVRNLTDMTTEIFLTFYPEAQGLFKNSHP